VSREVRIQDMSRADLEASLLLFQGLSRRLLEVVRENAKPEWKVRRECEAVASKYTGLLEVHVVKALSSELERDRLLRATAHNDRVWERTTGDAPTIK